MTGWFNPTMMSPNLTAQLRTSLALHYQAHSAQASQALQALQALDQMQFCGGAHAQQFNALQMAPQCGCVPQPQVQFSGAPAGKGLTKNPEGWPNGAIRTAGGYTVVPEGGSNAWKIYSPGQNPSDKPNTRIWGDPHVDEKDGTRWDFTKSSNFKLPDGTLIRANTTSETGQSITKSLEIINGNDSVQIGGIDKNRPQVGDVQHNGFARRMQLMSEGRDTFTLGGSKDNVQWFKTSGDQQGLITGAKYDGKQYVQNVDGNKQYCVCPEMRPEFGSRAWGNQLRSEMADYVARMPWFNSDQKKAYGEYLQQDHLMSRLASLSSPNAFGGTCGCFPSWGQASGAVTSLGDLMMMQQLMNMSRSGHLAHHMWC
jgi:hypothetical protein